MKFTPVMCNIFMHLYITENTKGVGGGKAKVKVIQKQDLCLNFIHKILLLILLSLPLFFETGFLCVALAVAVICSVDQTGLEFRHPPAFDCQVLGPKSCANKSKRKVNVLQMSRIEEQNIENKTNKRKCLERLSEAFHPGNRQVHLSLHSSKFNLSHPHLCRILPTASHQYHLQQKPHRFHS